MSIVVKTLNDFELREFSLDRLYSPSEQAQVKAGNSAYYAEVNRVKKAKELAEQEARKPRVLSPEELYQVRLAEDNKRKADQQARHDAQLLREKQHADYLTSDVPRAAIVCNSLFSFLNEFTNWHDRGYLLEVPSLDCQPPSLFVAYMNKPQTPAAKSNK